MPFAGGALAQGAQPAATEATSTTGAAASWGRPARLLLAHRVDRYARPMRSR
jgi:hypothetical protein